MKIKVFEKIDFRRIIFVAFIVFFGVVLRIFLNEQVGIPNFEAVTALSLLAGSFIGGIFVILVPIFTIFLSDLYFGNTSVFLFTWSAFILIGIFGTMIKRNSKHYTAKITGLGLASVFFFYLYTNFGWWLTSGMYSMTPQGLLQSYIAGIPFLRNQLVSALIFVPALIPIFSLLFENVKVGKPFTKSEKKITI